MDRFLLNSLLAISTGLSIVLIIGLVEFQPVSASTDGYGPTATLLISKASSH